MEKLQARLQAASTEYQKLQSDLSAAVDSRQRLDSQLQENEMVKKVKDIFRSREGHDSKILGGGGFPRSLLN